MATKPQKLFDKIRYAIYNNKTIRSQFAYINRQDYYGQTALSIAIKTFDCETIVTEKMETIVKIILDAGANPNLTDMTAITPLMTAMSMTAMSTSINIIKMLLFHGANVNCRDHLGRNALQFVDDWHDQFAECKINMLIAAGVNIDNQSSSGSSALTERISVNTCNILISAGANLNLRAYKYDTILVFYLVKRPRFVKPAIKAMVDRNDYFEMYPLIN